MSNFKKNMVKSTGFVFNHPWLKWLILSRCMIETHHFVWNLVLHAKLLVYFRNLALLGAWNLLTTFGAIGPKMVYHTLLWSHASNFYKQPLIWFEILYCTPSCQFISEIGLYWGPNFWPSDHFWDNWAQNGLTDITLEPHVHRCLLRHSGIFKWDGSIKSRCQDKCTTHYIYK